ncbi:MAG TPA: DUF4465 domain-containing protein, partial [Saprospiraceae bacterium]|nr:DUF4465 domain-containing protein [Saprospiraceae bacterium]
KGALETSAYGVAYAFDPAVIRLQPNAIGKPMIGMYVNNSTYAYYSMRDGDAFAKKFGGETGKDPDFFLLTIKKYSGGVLADDSINVYLADYRSPDPNKDYIISTWRYVDLSNLGEVDSLYLRLTSSDVGVFGMNTPAYFCVDQVSTDNLLSASFIDPDGAGLSLTTNPVQETMYLNLSRRGEVSVLNMQGMVLYKEKLDSGYHELPVSDWPRGLYLVSLDGRFAAKVSLE